jgi:hypothetical protein
MDATISVVKILIALKYRLGFWQTEVSEDNIVIATIRINELPVSATSWYHGSQKFFETWIYEKSKKCL